MMVNGPLDIYGVVLGVRMFDQLFNILASMGIIFLPLLVIFFQNITRPYESQFGNAASTSLRRVAIHFFLWVFTVMLFLAPTWSIATNDVTYTPECTASGTSPAISTFDHNGTNYKQAFLKEFPGDQFDDLKLPIMMTFVLDGMSGFTNAAIASLPCATDVAAITSIINNTRLTPSLATQVSQFSAQCYAPAKAKFINHPPQNYQNIMNSAGGKSDLSWIGSAVYQTFYYKKLYPTSPVMDSDFQGYKYPGQSSGSHQPGNGPNTVQGGYPSCYTWWTAQNVGLRDRLYNLMENNDPAAQNAYVDAVPFDKQVQSLKNTVPNFPQKVDFARDLVVRDFLQSHSAGNMGFGDNYTGWMNDNLYKNSDAFYGSGLVSSVADTLVTAGQLKHALEVSMTKRKEIEVEIPIIRAILLAFTLTLGPLILMLGMATGQGIRVIFTYYFMVGSLLFMTFIERFIHFLEVLLHNSQSVGIYALQNYGPMYNLFTELYLYGPMLYLMMMSLAGISIGGAVGSAFDNTATGLAASPIKGAKGLASTALQVGKFFV